MDLTKRPAMLRDAMRNIEASTRKVASICGIGTANSMAAIAATAMDAATGRISFNGLGEVRKDVQVQIVRDGNWHHVAVVLDSDGSPNVNEIELYVDGTEEAVPSDSQSINTLRARKVKIGLFSYSPVYFNGWLDDVRIYNRPLGHAEITALAAM